jgi:hypothetical protein
VANFLFIDDDFSDTGFGSEDIVASISGNGASSSGIGNSFLRIDISLLGIGSS